MNRKKINNTNLLAMADVPWSNDSEFQPQAVVNPDDYVMGLHVESGNPLLNFNIKYKNSDYLNAIASNIKVPYQLVYDDSVSDQKNANTNVVSGNPITFSSTEEVCRPYPSMSEAQLSAISPINGGISWTIDDDRLNVNVGNQLSPNNKKIAYIDDINSITEDVIYGECFFQENAQETVITAQSTPVKINGNYLAGELYGFSHIDGRLTFLELFQRVLSVSASFDCVLDLNTAQITAFVFKNGVKVDKSSISVSIDGVSPSFKTITIQCLEVFNPSDYVEIYIQNDSNTENLIIKDINFNVRSIGGASSGSSTFTLQDGYDNGDGSVLLDQNKPLSIDSNDNGVDYIPTIKFNQLLTPANSQIISSIESESKNDTLSALNFSEIHTKCISNVSNNESAEFSLNAMSNGVIINHFSYNGQTGATTINANLSLNNKSIFNLFNITQTAGDANFNASSAASGFFRINVQGTSGVYIDYATTRLDLDLSLNMLDKDIYNASKIGINTATVDSSAIFDPVSTTKGVLDTRMTSAQFNAIPSKAIGLRSYTTDDSRITLQTSSGIKKVAYTSDIVASSKDCSVLLSQTTPRGAYTSSLWTSIFNVFLGSKSIPASTLEIGDTIEVKASGNLTASVSGGSCSFRVKFGGLTGTVLATSQSFNYLTSGQFLVEISYKVTMVSATQFNASISGWVQDTSNNMKPIIMFVPLSQTFDPDLVNLIDIEFNPVFTAGNNLIFYAKNATILKYKFNP